MQTAAIADLIRRERRPLPSHELTGGNFRRYLAAVCQAEVAHREADFIRAANRIGWSCDRYLDPACIETGQFAHECHAGAVLNWLSHLQTHESMRERTFRQFREWSTAEKRRWLERRRYLWSGVLRQWRRYCEARPAIDCPAMREAA